MFAKDFEFPKIDKTTIMITTLSAEDGDAAYWRALTPIKRLRHLEVLRRINYGYRATERLQRVLEVVERTSG